MNSNINNRRGKSNMSVDTPTRPMNSGHDHEPTNNNYTDFQEKWKAEKRRKNFIKAGAATALLAGMSAIGLGVALKANSYEAPNPTAKPKTPASAPVTPGPEQSQAPSVDINKYTSVELAGMSVDKRAKVLYESGLVPSNLISGEPINPERNIYNIPAEGMNMWKAMIDQSIASHNNHALMAFSGTYGNNISDALQTRGLLHPDDNVSNRINIKTYEGGRLYYHQVDSLTSDAIIEIDNSGMLVGDNLDLAVEFTQVKVAPNKYITMMSLATHAAQLTQGADGSVQDDPFLDLEALRAQVADNQSPRP